MLRTVGTRHHDEKTVRRALQGELPPHLARRLHTVDRVDHHVPAQAQLVGGDILHTDVGRETGFERLRKPGLQESGLDHVDPEPDGSQPLRNAPGEGRLADARQASEDDEPRTGRQVSTSGPRTQRWNETAVPWA